MDPGLGLLVHLAEPDARVHGQIADELEDGQGHERDGLWQVLGLGLAGQTRTAVDDHGAGAADAGPAAEVEDEAGVLFLAQTVQRDEEGHVGGLLHHKGLHVRSGFLVLGIVAEYFKLEQSSHVVSLLLALRDGLGLDFLWVGMNDLAAAIAALSRRNLKMRGRLFVFEFRHGPPFGPVGQGAA